MMLLKGIEPDMVALWSEVEVWWDMVPAIAMLRLVKFCTQRTKPCNTALNAFLTQTLVTPRCRRVNKGHNHSIVENIRTSFHDSMLLMYRN